MVFCRTYLHECASQVEPIFTVICFRKVWSPFAFVKTTHISPFATVFWQHGSVIWQCCEWAARLSSRLKCSNHGSDGIAAKCVVVSHDVKGATNGFLTAVEAQLIEPHVLFEFHKAVVVNDSVFNLFRNHSVVAYCDDVGQRCWIAQHGSFDKCPAPCIKRTTKKLNN